MAVCALCQVRVIGWRTGPCLTAASAGGLRPLAGGSDGGGFMGVEWQQGYLRQPDWQLASAQPSSACTAGLDPIVA